MPSEHGKPSFLSGLGGFRALAALVVLVGHAAAWVTPLPSHPDLYSPFARLTHCGLSAFFVLSGFVLQYTHGGRLAGRRAIGRFALARLARIYPVYLLLLLVALADILLRVPEAVTRWPQNVAAVLTLTQSWVFLPEAPSLFPLAWAVSTEAFFYVLFPLAAWAVARPRTPGAAAGFGLGCIGAAVAADLLIAGNWPEIFAFAAARHPSFAGREAELAGNLFQWLTYVNPYIRCFEFLLGAATARLFALRPVRLPGLVPAALVCLAGLLTVPVPPGAFLWTILEDNILYAPFLAILCHGLAAGPATAVSGPLLARIGAASLSVYLVQPFVLPHFKLEAVFGSVPAWTVMALGGVAAVLWSGLALSRFVEVPLARLVLSRSGRPQPGVGASGRRGPSEIPSADTPAR